MPISCKQKMDVLCHFDYECKLVHIYIYICIITWKYAYDTTVAEDPKLLYVYGTKQFCSFTEFLFFVDFRIPCPNSPMHASEAFPNAFSHHGAATPDGTAALLFLPITATQTQKN